MSEAGGALDGPSGETHIADGVSRSLDPRAIPLGRVVGRILAASLSSPGAVAGTVTLLIAGPSVWLVVAGVAWVAATAGLAWWMHRWPAIHYRHASYTVNAEGLEIRRGVLWRKVISVPRSRVQHTDVSQGPLERRYGLGTLEIFTAGTDHAKVALDGLAHDDALAIRDHLLPLEALDAV